MTRLIRTLLLIFATALPLPQATADEWISEEYRCALTMPTQEIWTRALRPSLPAGEVIFHVNAMASSQGIMITYLPDLPSGDIQNPTVLKRITELLEAQGWKIESTTQFVRKNPPYVQFISERRDVARGKLVGISRVTPRGRNLYIVTAYGKGEADRVEDAAFMRVLESFRFIETTTAAAEHPAGPTAGFYRNAMFGTLCALGVLLVAWGAVLFRSREVEERA